MCDKSDINCIAPAGTVCTSDCVGCGYNASHEMVGEEVHGVIYHEKPANVPRETISFSSFEKPSADDIRYVSMSMDNMYKNVHGDFGVNGGVDDEVS